MMAWWCLEPDHHTLTYMLRNTHAFGDTQWVKFPRAADMFSSVAKHWNCKITILRKFNSLQMLFCVCTQIGHRKYICPVLFIILTHRFKGKIANIFHTTFSIVLIFWLLFHLSLFPSAQSKMSQHWFRQWLGTEQATIHYNETNNDPVHWPIFALLGLNILIKPISTL